MELQHVTHTFDPVYDQNSEILILGTFPSVKSRETQFYYGNRQNRFWKVLAAILQVPVPESIEEKKDMLLSAHIAIWDVIQSCDIKGSDDSSIANVVPNDLSGLLKETKIEKIFANGGKAYRLYQKYQFPVTRLPAVLLPSTSPANAAWTLDKLCGCWKENLLTAQSGIC